MSHSRRTEFTDVEIPDPRWQDLYRLGAVSFIALAALIFVAILAFFIWPYKGGFTSAANIFITLQNDRLGGLISLDLFVPILNCISILPMLALYVALKRVNESYALIALVLVLMGIVLWLTARPLAEMVYLSDQYAAATSDAAKNQYLAAGETFNALFNGTAWMLSQIFLAVSGLINSLLMLRSKIFSKATAYLGIVNSIAGLGILIPVFAIGAVLGLIGTFGGVTWYILLARTFFRLGWGQSNEVAASRKTALTERT